MLKDRQAYAENNHSKNPSNPTTNDVSYVVPFSHFSLSIVNHASTAYDKIIKLIPNGVEVFSYVLANPIIIRPIKIIKTEIQ